MQPDLNDIISALPAMKGDRDIIVPGKQSVADIMKEVIESHQVFAKDYDTIAGQFANSADPLRELFKFCKKMFPYVAESEKEQTSRSPIAIIMTADNWGVDCKHYAGFIAGVIDACNRAGYTNYNWCYRFASYDLLDPTKEHVFVVVDPGGNEIWLDPAPIENADGSFIGRSYNDRKIVPFYKTDKNVNMSIQRISGCCGDNINPHYQAMGYISMYGSLQSDLYTPDYGDNLYLTGGEYHLGPTMGVYQGSADILNNTVTVLPADVPYDPGTPTYNPADLNNIETVNDPVYPGTTQPITQPVSMQSITDKPVTQQSSGGGLSADLNIMEVIKANPVETILIGAGAVVAVIVIAKAMKKKKKR